MTHHNVPLIATDAFWALIALIIFCALLLYFKLPKILVKKLDQRAEDIANNLQDARRIKQEAQKLCAECQNKLEQAQQQAKEILDLAEREATQITNEIAQATQYYISQQRNIAQDKINLAQMEAIKDIRKKSIDLSVSVAQQILTSNKIASYNSQIIQHAVDEINSKKLTS